MQLQGLSKQFRGQGDRVETQTLSPTVSNDRGAAKNKQAWPKHVAMAALVLGLSACSNGGKLNLFHSNSAPAPQAAADSPVEAAPLPATTSKFGPTAVGQKAAQLRADFEKLRTNSQTRAAQLDTIRSQTVANVNSYHSRVGAIRSRL